MPTPSPTAAQLRALPKAVLHDHLDGGLRPSTVRELGAELGVEPPGGTDQAVAEWFDAAASSGSLPRYIATFERTLALMQTAPALRRIAREFVEDMVADGVVYAETRWAPQQHREGGLTMAEAVQAVQEGLDEGVAAAERDGQRIVVGQILSHMRQLPPTEELVELAADRRDRGVLGVDLAGPESGFPASRFSEVFRRAREREVPITIHAGEAEGVASIAQALDCGATRIGHGVRLIEDLGPEGGGPGGAGEPGPVAGRVLAEGICLEVCPRSNLQTGAAADMATHPVDRLARLGARVSISADNRLMSRTTTAREWERVVDAFGWTVADMERATLAALAAGFAPAAQREALRKDVVVPAYAAAREAAAR